MSLITEAQTLIIGLVFQVLSRAAPFRPQAAPRDTKWDVLAFGMGSLFVALYAYLVSGPLTTVVRGSGALSAWHAAVARAPLVAVVLVHLVVADLMAYWAHRLLHARLLWHSHAFHHSARHVWWASGLRAAPLHVFILSLPYTAAAIALPIGGTVPLLLGLAAFGIANQHWLHSNLAVPHASLLEHVLVTPRLHFVHHSADVRFTNSNYGFIFSLWDRWFGTYANPEAVARDQALGLDYENSRLRLLIGLPPPAADATHGTGRPGTRRTSLRGDRRGP